MGLLNIALSFCLDPLSKGIQDWSWRALETTHSKPVRGAGFPRMNSCVVPLHPETIYTTLTLSLN